MKIKKTKPKMSIKDRQYGRNAGVFRSQATSESDSNHEIRSFNFIRKRKSKR